MIEYRTFRNTDPPALTAVWRSCAGQRGLLQPVSVDLFEQLIFAKLYFDYHGLVLAFDDGQPVGFAHASFGPNAQRTGPCFETGVVCLVLARPGSEAQAVAAGLLDHCEKYLRARGAKMIYGGGAGCLNPFYLGLYGGSQLPGVLQTDALGMALYPSHGYEEIERILVFQRDLATFRAPIDRQQMQYRRQMSVQVSIDAPTRDWWEASTLGDFDLTRFELVPRGGGDILAQATLRGMQPPVGSPPGRAVGLIDLTIDHAHRRQGLGTFLLAESFRTQAGQGIATIEAQVPQGNEPGVNFVTKHGFQPTGQGIVFRKVLST